MQHCEDLRTLIKNNVTALCKAVTRIDIDVAIRLDTMIVVLDNTYLYVIPIENTCVVLGLSYNQMIDNDDVPPQMLQNMQIYNKVMYFYQLYDQYTKLRVPDAQIDDIRDLDDSIYSMKSTNGVKFIPINGNQLYHRYIYSVFAGNPNLNKSDLLSLQVYEINSSAYVLRCELFKKKLNKTIVCYSRNCNLDRKMNRY